MKYTIYKITNKINGKIYIGKHQTTNLNDGYFGSGKLIQRAVEKYDRENFEKKILHIYKTEEEMNQKEKDIVTEEFVKRKDTYNIAFGGKGGFSHINSNPKIFTKSRSKAGLVTWKKYGKLGNANFSKAAATAMLGKKHSKEARIKIGLASIGRTHSKETKQKMSLSSKGKGSGESNSQFGTIWITNGIKSKKIKKDEQIQEGWYKGRKMR